MSENLEKVKNYLYDLELKITHEDEAEELVVVENEEDGIKNLVIDCEPPIVVLEQFIMNVPNNADQFCRRLLQINRTLVHGAFAMDEEGKRIFFRDTLQLENLDFNELEASISALSLAMAEYGGELLEFSKS